MSKLEKFNQQAAKPEGKAALEALAKCGVDRAAVYSLSDNKLAFMSEEMIKKVDKLEAKGDASGKELKTAWSAWCATTVDPTHKHKTAIDFFDLSEAESEGESSGESSGEGSDTEDEAGDEYDDDKPKKKPSMIAAKKAAKAKAAAKPAKKAKGEKGRAGRPPADPQALLAAKKAAYEKAMAMYGGK